MSVESGCSSSRAPLVSIIIPTFNYGRYISNAINSALQQTYPNVEIVVVDDGSTDETQVVLAKYEGKIRSIRQDNQGASAARNRGIREAEGEYIAFLDADDRYRPDNIARKLSYLQQRPEFRWCYSNCVWVDASGREGMRGDQIDSMLLSLHAEGDVFLKALSGYLLGTNLFLFHRAVLQTVGGFDESLKVLEDYDVYVRAAHDYPIGYVDEVLVEIYSHEGSLGSSGGKKRGYMCRWRLNRKLTALYPESIRKAGRAWCRIQADVFRNLAELSMQKGNSNRAFVLLRRSLSFQWFQPGALKFLLPLRFLHRKHEHVSDRNLGLPQFWMHDVVVFCKRIVLRLLMRGMAATRSVPAEGEIRNIVLWQFGGVGDMLLAAPVIEALHRAYPNAAIHLWCSHPGIAEFLGRMPSVASIHAFHVYDFDSRTLLRRDVRRDFGRLADAMAAEKPDMLINLHVPAMLDWWFAEWLMIRRLAVPFTLGFDPRFLQESSLFNVSVNASVRDGIHYTRLYSMLLQKAGIECAERTIFPIEKVDQTGAAELLNECKVAGRAFVCMHIGANRLKLEGKMWPIERFVELAGKLIGQGYAVLLTGVQGERDMAEKLCAAVTSCCNLAGRTSLGEMAALISLADGFIGHDSGPFHVAVAVGTPCVAICGRPDAEPEYLAYDRGDVAVLTGASPEQITVDAVFTRAMGLFAHA